MIASVDPPPRESTPGRRRLQWSRAPKIGREGDDVRADVQRAEGDAVLLKKPRNFSQRDGEGGAAAAAASAKAWAGDPAAMQHRFRVDARRTVVRLRGGERAADVWAAGVRARRSLGCRHQQCDAWPLHWPAAVKACRLASSIAVL